MKTIVVCSGGMDSVTLAYKAAKEHFLTELITFDYGQRHKKEIDFAARCAKALGVSHRIIDISNIGAMLSGSALTDNIDVPEGHYAQETMKMTVVPNRNAIMMAISYGIAASCGAQAVGMAVHTGDHFIYPDCRPDFIRSFDVMQKHALENVAEIELYTPFLGMNKAAIAAEGYRLGVPYTDTWSCYKGEEQHCGRCGTCVERREAFVLARVDDPTSYDDPDFWIVATKNHKKAGVT